ncbi:MAG TPA: NADP-dependent malic enzyme [Candidatus Paceibacterota bacterium]|nr:NADP-dependent malic enzyme [Candidatus Paceibacterota bacterium]
MEPDKILAAYKKVGGRVETKGKVTLTSKEDFALFYTPGVGTVSTHLAAHPEDAKTLSVKGNSVAVISDGSAVLGLGNIGPYGALPVMEGKALIFKQFANIDAWPIVLDTQDPEKIIEAVRAIAPGFGGINLEDIAAPACFEIEERLIKELSIPVMHDDQHGTAIVVLAGLMNAAAVAGKDLKTMKLVIIGAGAAGAATALLLNEYGIHDVVVVDRKGTIDASREDLTDVKQELARRTNPRHIQGALENALMGADAVIGLSGGGKLTSSHIETMAPNPIVFALANPTPEILPEDAKKGGAAIVATGRSDFPNQINNALVFPGIFRGALDGNVTAITTTMKLKAAAALAALVSSPSADCIIPEVLDERVVPTIAAAVQ